MRGERHLCRTAPELRPLPKKTLSPPPADADLLTDACPFSRRDLPALNERQRLAMQHIHAHGVITRVEYASLTGNISARTMQNDLRRLVDLGVIKRVGGGPNTSYVLVRRPLNSTK